MSKPNQKKLDKDIQDLLSNILILNGTKLDPDLPTHLGEYAGALLNPLLNHIDDPEMTLTEPEGIQILVGCALILQTRITGNMKVPTLGHAASLIQYKKQ